MSDTAAPDHAPSIPEPAGHAAWDLESLLAPAAPQVLFECVVGSVAYGLATTASDIDRRGIFAVPAARYLGLRPPPEQVQDARGDTVYLSLRRYLELIADGNPNSLELLYVPEDCRRRTHAAFSPLLQARHRFVTRHGVDRHVGYAESQIKRARGRNKWINQPQPETPPDLAAFCQIVPLATRMAGVLMAPESSAPGPARPIPLLASGWNLARFHAASVEHATGVYRLYDIGASARGVIRGGQIACEPISLDDEWTRFRGLLVVNRIAYDQAVRDHAQYWEWRRLRNESRWQAQETGELDYDAKNMMHTLRLLYVADSMVRHGAPAIRVTPDERELLLAVRRGTHTYDTLIGMVDTRIAAIRDALPACDLPPLVEPGLADDLLARITHTWEAGR